MKKFSLSLTFALLFLAPFLEAQSLKPGLWKGKVNFNINGIALPENGDENCISPKDAKDIKSTISEHLKEKKCTLTKWNMKGKKIEAGLVCKSDELDATGTMKGQFTEKSYNLTGEASGTYQSMIPASATINLIGEWVKACTE